MTELAANEKADALEKAAKFSAVRSVRLVAGSAGQSDQLRVFKCGLLALNLATIST
jgi:hypothetical protein